MTPTPTATAYEQHFISGILTGLIDRVTKLEKEIAELKSKEELHPAKSWEVDKKLLLSIDGERWHKGYFSHFKDGLFYTFAYGRTSWTQSGVTGYKYAKPAEENK